MHGLPKLIPGLLFVITDITIAIICICVGYIYEAVNYAFC